jgi:hypothetical protein
LLNPRCHLSTPRDNRVREIAWGEHDTTDTGERFIGPEDLDRILKLVLDRILGEKRSPPDDRGHHRHRAPVQRDTTRA